MQSQLDDGEDDFSEIKLALNTMKHEINFTRANASEKATSLATLIKSIEDVVNKHDKSLTLIRDHHKRNHGEAVE